jgi:histidyl-tRNA synthetase
LRILDTKNPAMQEVAEAAPKLIDHLGSESMKHFDALRAMLDAAGQPYRVNPRLVRGMDYYSLTVFEWVTDKLGAQGTICGGGRYDGLVELLGGKPAPGIGWGLGIERVLDLMQQLDAMPPAPVPDAYAVVPDAAALPVVTAVVEALRATGLAVTLHAGGCSMKAQFRRADASGARHALVFGADELARGEVALKPLRDAATEQIALPLTDAAQWASRLRPPP